MDGSGNFSPIQNSRWAKSAFVWSKDCLVWMKTSSEVQRMKRPEPLQLFFEDKKPLFFVAGKLSQLCVHLSFFLIWANNEKPFNLSSCLKPAPPMGSHFALVIPQSNQQFLTWFSDGKSDEEKEKSGRESGRVCDCTTSPDVTTTFPEA